MNACLGFAKTLICLAKKNGVVNINKQRNLMKIVLKFVLHSLVG